MNRTIELYLTPGQYTAPAARILRAFHDASGPDDHVFGTRIVTLNADIASNDVQTLIVTVDLQGARVRFEDEVPNAVTDLLGPNDVGEIVITDWVPDGCGPKLEPGAGYSRTIESAYAWRVTPRLCQGQMVHELVTRATNLPLAIDCLEGLRAGERPAEAAQGWMLSPWRRVGLGL